MRHVYTGGVGGLCGLKLKKERKEEKSVGLCALGFGNLGSKRRLAGVVQYDTRSRA